MNWSKDGIFLASNNSILPFQLKAAYEQNDLEYLKSLDFTCPSIPHNLTSIMVTYGPAMRKPGILKQILKLGVTMVRINYTSDPYEVLLEDITYIREITKDYSNEIGREYPIIIAADIKGPDIRTGFFAVGYCVKLEEGAVVRLTSDKAYKRKCTAQNVYVGYAKIFALEIGTEIFIDFGKIKLAVTSTQASAAVCTVITGNVLGNDKNVEFKNIEIDMPNLSDTDKADIKFFLTHKIDYFIYSLVHNKHSLAELHEFLGDSKKDIGIISKIESRQGVDNLMDIIEGSDAIFIGRGILAMQYTLPQIATLQKQLNAKCAFRKPIIISTQLLSSMADNPFPTPGEVADVTNAVDDGVDIFLLTDETTIGFYPVQAVQTLCDICKQADTAFWAQAFIDISCRSTLPPDAAHALAYTAVLTAFKTLASAIIVVTTNGLSPRILSQYRPKCQIIAVTNNLPLAKRCNLYKGVSSIYYNTDPNLNIEKTTAALIKYGINVAKVEFSVMSGDPIVICIIGSDYWKNTNMLKIEYISDLVSPTSV